MPQTSDHGENPPTSELDVTIPLARRIMRSKATWSAVLFVCILLFSSLESGNASDFIVALEFWLLFGVLPGLLLIPPMIVYAGWIIVVRKGIFTWLPLAHAPALAIARGDSARAERAFRKALERAKRFSAKDQRRGLMLVELSRFVKNQGRYREAKVLLDECVEILACHQRTSPTDYFNALNLFAVYFIELRDYAAAQCILKKVFDLTVVASKAHEEWTDFQHNEINEITFMLCLSLVSLLIEIRELTEASYHLKEADSIFPNLWSRTRAMWHDHYIATRTSLMIALGNFVDAGREIVRAKNPEYPTCLLANAMLLLLGQDFNQGEQVLRKYFKQQRIMGTLHRPELLQPTLHFAESLFGQAKHDDAFASLQEARAIVADFALPADAAWRKTLETWLPRARELGKADVAAALEAELISFLKGAYPCCRIASWLRPASSSSL